MIIKLHSSDEVQLAADLNNWSPIDGYLYNDFYYFYIDFNDVVYFKFIVNNTWITSDTYPLSNDEFNNNVISKFDLIARNKSEGDDKLFRDGEWVGFNENVIDDAEISDSEVSGENGDGVIITDAGSESKSVSAPLISVSEIVTSTPVSGETDVIPASGSISEILASGAGAKNKSEAVITATKSNSEAKSFDPVSECVSGNAETPKFSEDTPELIFKVDSISNAAPDLFLTVENKSELEVENDVISGEGDNDADSNPSVVEGFVGAIDITVREIGDVIDKISGNTNADKNETGIKSGIIDIGLSNDSTQCKVDTGEIFNENTKSKNDYAALLSDSTTSSTSKSLGTVGDSNLGDKIVGATLNPNLVKSENEKLKGDGLVFDNEKCSPKNVNGDSAHENVDLNKSDKEKVNLDVDENNSSAENMIKNYDLELNETKTKSALNPYSTKTNEDLKFSDNGSPKVGGNNFPGESLPNSPSSLTKSRFRSLKDLDVFDNEDKSIPSLVQKELAVTNSIQDELVDDNNKEVAKGIYHLIDSPVENKILKDEEPKNLNLIGGDNKLSLLSDELDVQVGKGDIELIKSKRGSIGKTDQTLIGNDQPQEPDSRFLRTKNPITSLVEDKTVDQLVDEKLDNKILSKSLETKSEVVPKQFLSKKLDKLLTIDDNGLKNGVGSTNLLNLKPPLLEVDGINDDTESLLDQVLTPLNGNNTTSEAKSFGKLRKSTKLSNLSGIPKSSDSFDTSSTLSSDDFKFVSANTSGPEHSFLSANTSVPKHSIIKPFLGSVGEDLDDSFMSAKTGLHDSDILSDSEFNYSSNHSSFASVAKPDNFQSADSQPDGIIKKNPEYKFQDHTPVYSRISSSTNIRNESKVTIPGSFQNVDDNSKGGLIDKFKNFFKF